MRWQSGINNFITYEIIDNHLHTTISDEHAQHNNLKDIFRQHVDHRGSCPVELLYSGGLDSEIVLLALHESLVPIIAYTADIKCKNITINGHDLYYATKLCSQLGIQHKIIPFHLDRFFDNGDHLMFTEPYGITQPNVVIQLWLAQNTNKFPVIGGDWPWLQTIKNVFSPYRKDFVVGELFMRDKGITGINNMISYSFDSCRKFIWAQASKGLGSGWINQSLNKQVMYKLLGYDLEPRIKAYGLDLLDYDSTLYNLAFLRNDLISRYGVSTSSISWDVGLGGFLNIPPGTNDKFS